MKQTCLAFFALLTLTVYSQQPSPKEIADSLAQTSFSKHKHKHKEKKGKVTDVNIDIVSTPVVANDDFYQGNYVYKDLNYKIEIRKNTSGSLIATLKIGSSDPIALQNVSVKDAYFTAVKTNADGTTENWEGVFINVNDGTTTEFGLGIKPARPISIESGLQISKLFFKKVSP